MLYSSAITGRPKGVLPVVESQAIDADNPLFQITRTLLQSLWFGGMPEDPDADKARGIAYVLPSWLQHGQFFLAIIFEPLVHCVGEDLGSILIFLPKIIDSRSARRVALIVGAPHDIAIFLEPFDER